MRKIIVAVALLLAVSAFGQKTPESIFIKAREGSDTVFHVRDTTYKTLRIKPAKFNDLYDLSNTEMIDNHIDDLQHRLDLVREYGINAKRGISLNVLEYVESIINDMEGKYSGFDFSPYKNEVKLFRYFNAQDDALKLQKQRVKDSLALVEKREIQIELDRQDSLRSVEKQRIAKRNAIEQKRYEAEVLKKFGQKNGKKIIAHEVELGMTKDMCMYSWGTSYTENITKLNGVTATTWVYSPLRWLIFKNGKLVSITR